mgnify:CR=1 FL=1
MTRKRIFFYSDNTQLCLSPTSSLGKADRCLGVEKALAALREAERKEETVDDALRRLLGTDGEDR